MKADPRRTLSFALAVCLGLPTHARGGERHWSFEPPRRPDVPTMSDPTWPRGAIDRFVMARLDREGLRPSPEADRRTLIRRVSFDLTGLPPTAAEVRAFATDPDPDAYERMVDRLLASPHFGERMALPWLDLARYADTNGYSIDGGRHMWLWRDWVIQAWNDNMRFDRFLTEQLAGDLLDEATEAQRVATGFLRNHMITHEGGTIPEENLTNYCADRVRTTAEAFLGLTMGCAQCHDHKYDPITQRDYYRFFAYFNTLGDRGLDGDGGHNAAPSILARSPLTHDVAAIDAQLATLRAELHRPRPRAQRRFEESLRDAEYARGRDLKLHELGIESAKSPNRNLERVSVEGGRVVALHGGVKLAFTIAARLPSVALDGLRVVFDPSDECGGALGYCGAEGHHGSFFLSGVSASVGAMPSEEIDLNQTVPLVDATASASHPDFPPRGALDERNHDAWSPWPDVDRSQHITLHFGRRVDGRVTPHLTVLLNFFSEHGGGHNNPGRIRLLGLQGHDDDTNLPSELVDLLSIPSAERTEAERVEADEWFRRLAPDLASLRDRIASTERRRQEMTAAFPVMVMDTAEAPRRTSLLARGDYASPTEEVTPGVPAALDPGAADIPDRLALARWLASEDHPLTARVGVNRFWQMLFGTGLVATAADFGVRGERPSHPELLDWLAREFVAGGFDVKALLREIVTSATYRQSSATTPELLAIDPDNRLLARGPRFRLPAEHIRDAALKTSGLLVPWIGGASVSPQQPPNLWKEVSHYGSTPATSQVFVADRYLECHRRSLYTYWKRTVPPPNLTLFDAPNREVCTASRSRTNTPLQALVLLNDPQFVETAHALAARIAEEHPSTSYPQQALIAFDEVVGRPPNADERVILESFARDTDLAGVATLLFNLSEWVTRE